MDSTARRVTARHGMEKPRHVDTQLKTRIANSIRDNGSEWILPQAPLHGHIDVVFRHYCRLALPCCSQLASTSTGK
jgi:hypothetical protein